MDEQAPFVMLGSIKVTSFNAFSMCTQVMTALSHDDIQHHYHMHTKFPTPDICSPDTTSVYSPLRRLLHMMLPEAFCS